MNNVLDYCEAVPHLRFANGTVVACTEDLFIAVSNSASSTQTQAVDCSAHSTTSSFQHRNPPQKSHENEVDLRGADSFERRSGGNRVASVGRLLSLEDHNQHSRVNSTSTSMLRVDFISLLPRRGLDHVAENILSNLDVKSLVNAQCVSREWYCVIAAEMLWKELIQRQVRSDPQWRGLAERRGWMKYLFKLKPENRPQSRLFYRALYPAVVTDIHAIEDNWKNGAPTLQKINCQSTEPGGTITTLPSSEPS